MSKRQFTTNDFIIKAKEAHGERYDYSCSVYTKNKEPISILCKIHGLFNQSPAEHWKGANCPLCAKVITKPTFTNEQFIKKSIEKHGLKYDYSQCIYKNSHNKVSIICPIHGLFEQKACAHLRGNGCFKCSIDKKATNKRLNTQDFIKKSIEKHGNIYDYSNTVYIDSQDKLSIACPIHGEFIQTATNHMNDGNGCPHCYDRVTKPMKELCDFFNSLGFIQNVDFIINDRTVISPYELDFLFPKLNIAIEFNGNYWHNAAIKTPSYHKMKTDLAESKNIHLIHIFEYQWNSNKNIILSRLSNILNKTLNRIFSRKCTLSKIDAKAAKQFFDDNHLQGGNYYNINYALIFNNEIVSVMSFLKKNNIYELVRFANKINTNVIGSANKLMSSFRKDYTNSTIISYADRSWSHSQKNLYVTLGFTCKTIGKPNYSWCSPNGTVFNKKAFQKKLILKKFPNSNLNNDMTENEMMTLLGFYKIYNSGIITYILT